MDQLEMQFELGTLNASHGNLSTPGLRSGTTSKRTKSKRRTVSPGLRPTPEQASAIQMFVSGGSLKINAYAGTGKTSTLAMLADSSLKSGQYIAFNQAIVRDAKKRFPKRVNGSTSHSLARQGTPPALKEDDRKMRGSINAHQLAQLLDLGRWQIDKHFMLPGRSQAFLYLETIKRFAQSSDPEPAAVHVPRLGSLAIAPKAVWDAVTEHCVKWVKKLWGRMRTPYDQLPLGHDGYLKLWCLSEPTIAGDFIFLDEAQDTNPVILGVLAKQKAQMIYVGDRYQQIYEWRGAVNAMERIETAASTSLTTSFRFGEAIAQYASKILELLGETERLHGNPNISSRIGLVRPCAILARTNASAIAATMEALDQGKHPHLVGGTGELLAMLRGVQDLKRGEQSSVAEFLGFNRWHEVVEFAKSGEAQHLLTFANLVESRGEQRLIAALESSVNEEECDIVISTAHKSKGREWTSVKLMDDFLKPKPKHCSEQVSFDRDDRFDAADLRLFYVAVTRAKESLEIAPAMLDMIRP